MFSGLQLRFLCQLLRISFIFAAFFLTNRYISRAEGTATIEQLHTGSAGCRRTMKDLKVFELAELKMIIVIRCQPNLFAAA